VRNAVFDDTQCDRSPPTLERKCREEIGLNPPILCLIRRFSGGSGLGASTGFIERNQRVTDLISIILKSLIKPLPQLLSDFAPRASVDSKRVTLAGSGRLPSGAHRPRACRSRFWGCPPIQGESPLPIRFRCCSWPACSKRNEHRPGGIITSRTSSARGPRAGRPTIPVAAPLPAPERSLVSRCTNLSPSATNTPHPRWECWAFIVR
jgi:hypothetical protein